MRNGSLTLGRIPQRSAKVTGRGEPVVDVLPRPLARLSSEKAALVRHFRCTEFELRARVAIALNKLDASSMETTRIRAPLVARSNADSPGPPRLSNARSFLDSASNLYMMYGAMIGSFVHLILLLLLLLHKNEHA